MKIQVNMNAKVNSQAIRREKHNGRDHWIIPSYTLPAGVIMNGGLYPASEIDAHYKGLEGTLAPLGHPTMDGKFISAFSPEGINVGHIGAWNRNVKKAGNRVYVEKWVDIEIASRHPDGQRLIERLTAIEKGQDVPPIHTSVAVFLEAVPNAEGSEDPGYQWTAKIHGMDHDAILLDEVGAATPEQGVGMMVNVEDAKLLVANSGVLEGPTYRDRERYLDEAARKRWAPGNDDMAYVYDFNATRAIIVYRNAGNESAKVAFDYTLTGDVATFADQGVAVEQETTWVEKLQKVPAVNKIIEFFTNRQARPGITTEGDMPLTKEERDALVSETAAAFAPIMANALSEAMKGVNTQLTTLEANQKAMTDSITANSRQAEADKRAIVAKKFGDVVANSLSGEPLDEMVKQCGEAAPILNGNNANDSDKPATGAPDPAAYFKQGA